MAESQATLPGASAGSFMRAAYHSCCRFGLMCQMGIAVIVTPTIIGSSRLSSAQSVAFLNSARAVDFAKGSG